MKLKRLWPVRRHGLFAFLYFRDWSFIPINGRKNTATLSLLIRERIVASRTDQYTRVGDVNVQCCQARDLLQNCPERGVVECDRESRHIRWREITRIKTRSLTRIGLLQSRSAYDKRNTLLLLIIVGWIQFDRSNPQEIYCFFYGCVLESNLGNNYAFEILSDLISQLIAMSYASGQKKDECCYYAETHFLANVERVHPYQRGRTSITGLRLKLRKSV